MHPERPKARAGTRPGRASRTGLSHPEWAGRVRGGQAVISAPLLRIVLGREWKAYAAWSLGSACVLRFCAGSFPSLYPTAEARRNVAATFRIPVAKVFGGAGYGLDGPNPRIGAILATRPLLFCLLLAAFMATVTVLRWTRGDEERRSSELVRSTAVGRLEPAVCSLASAAIGSACAGAACAAAAIAGGLEAADSLAMGAGIAMVGLCSASSALVVTAVAPSARGATAGGMTLLLVWFSIRGLALMRESAGFLSWATPFGLAQEMRPWAGVRWGPFAAGVAAAVAVGALGLLLHSGRQWGAGRFGAFLSAGRGRARPARTGSSRRRWAPPAGCAAGGSRAAWPSASSTAPSPWASGTRWTPSRRCSKAASSWRNWPSRA